MTHQCEMIYLSRGRTHECCPKPAVRLYVPVNAGRAGTRYVSLCDECYRLYCKETRGEK